MPGSGTLRVGIPRPAPLRIPGTGVDRTSTEPRRPTAARMAADDPQRKAARALALKLIAVEGGAARVARMAAADVGARSEAAARVLAERADYPVLKRLAGHHDARVREGLARALAFRPRFGPVLLGELLGDWSLKVVRAAVRTAAQIGSAPVVGRLASLALRYDRSIRSLALQALAQHARIPVARRTVIAAATHSTPAVREDALVAIGLARATWARYFVLRLARDPSPAVRRSVARALGRLPPEPAAFQALGRLSQDRSPRVRREASRAAADLRRAAQAAKAAARRGRKPRR